MRYEGNHTAITTPLLVSPQGEQLPSSSQLANSQTPTQPATQDRDRSIFCLPIAFHNKLSGIFSLPGAFPVSLFRREDTTSSCPYGGSQGWVQLCSCRGPSSYKPSMGSAGCSLHQAVLTAGSQPPDFLPPSRNRGLAFRSILSLLTSYTTNSSAEVVKMTSLQYLQISNRILTPTGFLPEIYCEFQLGVIKTSSLFFSPPVVLVVVLCVATN